MLMHLKFRGERAKSGRAIAPVGVAVAVAVADASPHFITCIISPWDRARPRQATIESSVVDRPSRPGPSSAWAPLGCCCFIYLGSFVCLALRLGHGERQLMPSKLMVQFEWLDAGGPLPWLLMMMMMMTSPASSNPCSCGL